MYRSRKEGGQQLALPAARESCHQLSVDPESVLRNRLVACPSIKGVVRRIRNVRTNELDVTIGKQVPDDLSGMIARRTPSDPGSSRPSPKQKYMARRWGRRTRRCRRPAHQYQKGL
jgi:hypothetical protein